MEKHQPSVEDLNFVVTKSHIKKHPSIDNIEKIIRSNYNLNCKLQLLSRMRSNNQVYLLLGPEVARILGFKLAYMLPFIKSKCDQKLTGIDISDKKYCKFLVETEPRKYFIDIPWNSIREIYLHGLTKLKFNTINEGPYFCMNFELPYERSQFLSSLFHQSYFLTDWIEPNMIRLYLINRDL